MSSALTPLRELDDDELMARVQANETAAFSALFDRFVIRASRVVFVIAHDHDRTDDIVQDAFLSVWRGRSRYQPEDGNVRSWVMSVVRNRAIDSLRHNGRHDRRRADEGWIDTRPQARRSLEQAVIERDEAAHLRSTLARLPANQREVIALAYFGELSTSEIAARLELPLGTVKGRIRLGLTKLHCDLERHDEA